MIVLALVAALSQDPEFIEGLPACSANALSVIRESDYSMPAAGEERTADVGEPVLLATRYQVRESGITLAEDIVVSGSTSRAPFTLTIPAGTNMVLEGPGYSAAQYRFEGRGPNPTSVHFEGGGTVARISWGWAKERHPVSQGQFRLDRGQCFAVSRNSLTRQLAFTGVSRGVVSLEYREFSGDLARPAFTQSATYDLAEGKVIGFRGARIEVISADNLGVRYRVIQGFD